ncbi:hypothetical protein [Spiroplasma sp. SV19]|uniref:hypothetical protein n=1 Tax=Spiroplasma sp. SV19 TaxID=2570468 RepID=UPI0024B68ADE|nr:hypothetical protein [Spiroplasma sp. SV19]
MKKIIDSIEQIISVCGQDFTKWPNNMAPDVLKATYEMLKEYQEQLSGYKADEVFSKNDREQILEKVKSFYENKLDEKDKEIEKLKYDNAIYTDELYKKDEKQLKKSDFELLESCGACTKIHWMLKDNTKYESLEE